MSNKDHFSRKASRTIYEFMRSERQLSQTLSREVSTAFGLRQKLFALKNPLLQYVELQKLGAFGEIGVAKQFYNNNFNNLRSQTMLQWASAIRASALTANSQNKAMNMKIHTLGNSVNVGISNTARALQNNNSLLTAAMAASNWQNQFKNLSEVISPNLTALRATAERMALLDIATLSSTVDSLQADKIHATVQQAIEAQRVVEAFGEISSPEEGVKLFIDFIALIATILGQFKANTVQELKSLGLLSVFTILIALISIFPRDLPEGHTPEQEKAFDDLRYKIDTMQSQLHELQDAQNELDEAYISDIPRAELKRRSNIRHSPNKEAPKILIARPGTLIAVAESEGRWRQVIFRDPLSDQLSQGWVYYSSVSMLDNNIP